MPQVAIELEVADQQQESARLAALYATGILDTPPEPGYDAITRLAAEYFQADSAAIAFADESRIWMKSCWRQVIRELPRKNSFFDLILAEDGPVVVSDIMQTFSMRRAIAAAQTTRHGFFCRGSGALQRWKYSRNSDHLPP